MRAAAAACDAESVEAAPRGHDWASADWNWGYASGSAHDAAGELRGRLSSPPARRAWLVDVLAGGIVPWDETQLALALLWQRATREGRDAGFGEVLARMAAGEFESPAGQESLLEEIERVSMGLGLPEGLDAELAEELMGGGRVSFEARRRETAVLTALRMQFVTLGM